MKRAIFLTCSGFKDHELIYPYYRLLGAGFEATVVTDSRDSRNRFYGEYGANMPADVLLAEFGESAAEFHERFDFLVIPGGAKAIEKLRVDRRAIEFIAAWDARGKVIASTCHGAQLLISARIVKGRKISAYHSIRDDVENAGAEFVDAPAVRDRNIVSSPHYDHMGEWMEVALATYFEISASGI
jgi:protease I